LKDAERKDPVAFPRGESPVSFTYTFPEAGDYVVQVKLDGDELPVDDERSMVVHVRDSIPVLLVNGKPAASLYDEATEYLLDAVNPFQKGTAPAFAPYRPHKITAAEFTDARKGDLTNYDCVFLCDVPRIGEQEAQRLEQHVLRGGGLVICLGPDVDIASYNTWLYRDGHGLLPARLLGPHRAAAGTHIHFNADVTELEEPPLKAFGDDDRARLLSARFYEIMKTDLVTAAKGGVKPRRVLSFLSQADDPDRKPLGGSAGEYLSEAAVVEWQPPLIRGKAPEAETDRRRMPLVPPTRGRVVLYTSSTNTDWTDWPRQASFVWFMQEVLSLTSVGRLGEESSLVGETLEHYLAGTAGAVRDVTITTPDGRSETTRTLAHDQTALWRWSDTDVSGIYLAQVGKHPRQQAFAVNFPATIRRHGERPRKTGDDG
jgi:hypothetical protein